MSLIFKTAYWNDKSSRDAFIAFMKESFGLDFGKWLDYGYWDDSYIPFSFFDNGIVVANVCLYVLDVVVDGRPGKMIQVSAVYTEEGRRRKGLSRELTRLGLEGVQEKAADVFLFATDVAIPYYRKLGFIPSKEYIEIAQVKGSGRRPGCKKLDPLDPVTLKRIYEYGLRRAPLSQKFSVINPKLLVFHALYAQTNSVYELPELDCLVLLKRKEDCLQILDVVGSSIPCFDELYPFISAESDRRVEFHFYTDRLRIEGTTLEELRGNNLFRNEAFPIKNPVFPYTSRA